VKTYDLYGTSKLSAAELRDRVTRLVGVEFEERDSSYRGAYYRAGDLRGEHFVVLANGPEEGPDELAEPDFSDKPVLLEVNATGRAGSLRELLATIPELTLLRSKSI
jgi:hypothetical protein